MHAAGKYRLLSFLFARKPQDEAVTTRVHLDSGAEPVWNRILFYEDVPGRPPLLLRVLLPRPVRTEGGKTRVGAAIRCVYQGGELLKRITAVEPLRQVRFDVVDQHLGIEGCVLTLGGSYQVCPCGGGTDVVLCTRYRAFLHPRALWRPLEALLVGQLHRHILDGIRAAGAPALAPASRPAATKSFAPQCAAPGGPACTPSPSRFRR